MPIKNYTTRVPANRSIQEIQTSLVDHGATGVLYEYEKGTGRIRALRFRLVVKDKEIPFSLPVNWRKFQEVLRQQEVKNWDDEDYVYRVAWRNIRDWVMAQLAFYETDIVELPQVFLPFATTPTGTIYENLLDSKFLLDTPPAGGGK